MKPTPEQVAALTDAAWQVLDDMGECGNSCSGAAKAMLRAAFEPFREPELEVDYSLAAAEAVLREVGIL